MNNMEEALYRAGAHIVFKTVQPKPEPETPTRRMKVPVPYWRKRKMERKADQRIIGGIALDPVDRQAAIVTSRAPLECRLQHSPLNVEWWRRRGKG
jgi:hypothetical protein